VQKETYIQRTKQAEQPNPVYFGCGASGI
jgi:hypothetical protein